MNSFVNIKQRKTVELLYFISTDKSSA